MMDRKYILNFTPTGMIPTKEMTPHVPVSPAEISAEVTMAAEMGVSMVHLHARDADTGKPTYKKEIYHEIVSEIRSKHPDMILCLSTSGRDFSEFEKRADCLDLDGDLKPEFGA